MMFAGVSATSSGSVGGSSGSGSSSGVIDLQQPGTESSSSRLAAGSGTNTLQYSNGYVSCLITHALLFRRRCNLRSG